MNTEATMSLFKADDGWRYKIVFDDGLEGYSEQVFETQDEAARAFKAWTAQLGIQVHSAH
jgi:hypothetical protein